MKLRRREHCWEECQYCQQTQAIRELLVSCYSSNLMEASLKWALMECLPCLLVYYWMYDTLVDAQRGRSELSMMDGQSRGVRWG